MQQLNKNDEYVILDCHNKYRSWFLSLNDFSCFDKEDIEIALEEEKPAYYPCVPFISEDRQVIFYVGIDIMERVMMNHSREVKYSLMDEAD